MNDPDVAPRLDLRGLNCPLPVLRTRKALMEMAPGALIAVETTDPLAVIDIPAFCAEAGHALRAKSREDGYDLFVIARGPA